MKIKDILRHYEAQRGKVVADPVRLSIIVRHLLKFFGEMESSQVGFQTEVEYSNWRVVSDSTVRRELGVLIASFNFAVKTRLIPLGEVPYISLPVGAPPKDVWLTENEVKFLLQRAIEVDPKFGSRVYRFVVIALKTASRKAAILNLKWSQVDLERKVIHYEGGVQTKKRRVAVPISASLMQCLDYWKEGAENEYVLGSPDCIDWEFGKLMRECAKTNAKFESVTPHTLRHTWATLAARAGVDLWQIAGVLGDTLSTVQKNYLHHCPDHLRGAVEFMG
jgi:integrase